MIGEPVAAASSQHAEADPEQDAEAQRAEGELERGRQAIAEVAEHRPASGERGTHVAVQQVLHVREVLHLSLIHISEPTRPY